MTDRTDPSVDENVEILVKLYLRVNCSRVRLFAFGACSNMRFCALYSTKTKDFCDEFYDFMSFVVEIFGGTERQ